jgi:DNA-binding Lrp family transcriptional regulator
VVDVTTIQGVFALYENSDLGWADIAKKIGVSEQTLYYYKRKLKNKEVKKIDSIETKWLGREI